MRKKVAYLRVSTENQTEKFGLDLQKNAIDKYCKEHNITLDDWYIDGGFSGAKLERPEIQRLLKDIEDDKIDTIYAYRLDRISRNTVDSLSILLDILPKHKSNIVSVSENIGIEKPSDRFMLTITAGLSQYEREIIKARMNAGILERVKRGKHKGGNSISKGYYYDRNTGNLEINESEAAIVKEMFKLYLEGMPITHIAYKFQTESTNVKVILKNITYIGKQKYKGEVYDALHTPIIDEETFYKVQYLLQRNTGKRRTVGRRLLTSLCVCPECGGRMYYNEQRTSFNITCKVHRHKKWANEVLHKTCSNNGMRALKVEEEVVNTFKQFLINIDENTLDTTEYDELQMLNNQYEEIKKKLKKLYDLYAINDNDALLETITENENKLKTITDKILIIEKSKTSDDKVDIKAIKRIADVWDSLSVIEQNDVLRMCIDKILVSQNDIKIYFLLG